MNICCFDYGFKRIGVATSQGMLAEPLKVITNDTKETSDFLGTSAAKEIAQLLQTHAIDRVVVGLPSGPMEQKVLSFVEFLRDTCGMQVETADETLSSQEAQRLSSNFKKSKRAGPQDHFAAALILQEYLDINVV